MQQGYIVLHNYPSLSLILVTYIIIDSHTKIELFQTYILFVCCCFFVVVFLHILNYISKAALICIWQV